MAKEKHDLTVEPIVSLEDERLSKPGEPIPKVDLFGNTPDNPPTSLHCTGGYYVLLPHRQLTPDEVPLVEMARKEIASLTEPIDVPNRSEQKPGTVPVSLTVPPENFPQKGVIASPAGDSAGEPEAGAVTNTGNRRLNIGDPGGRRDEIKAANEKKAAKDVKDE